VTLENSNDDGMAKMNVKPLPDGKFVYVLCTLSTLSIEKITSAKRSEELFVPLSQHQSKPIAKKK
jgi:hypothetical protein